MLSRRQKGEYAKQRAILRAVERGYAVSVPTMDCRYDLVVDDGVRLSRVQVKYADGTPSASTGAVMANLATWDNKSIPRKCRTYTAAEIDYVLVYLPKLDLLVRLDPDRFVGRRSIIIRIESPKNCQTRKMNLASALAW